MTGSDSDGAQDAQQENPAASMAVLKNAALHDDDEEQRFESMDELSQIASRAGDPALTAEIVGILGEVLKDPAPDVRRGAENRLKSLVLHDGADPVRVVKMFAPLLCDPDIDVRSDAASNIEQIVDQTHSQIDPLEAGKLRELFRAQADATHWWEFRVRRDSRNVIKALDEVATPRP